MLGLENIFAKETNPRQLLDHLHQPSFLEKISRFCVQHNLVFKQHLQQLCLIFFTLSFYELLSSVWISWIRINIVLSFNVVYDVRMILTTFDNICMLICVMLLVIYMLNYFRLQLSLIEFYVHFFSFFKSGFKFYNVKINKLNNIWKNSYFSFKFWIRDNINFLFLN